VAGGIATFALAFAFMWIVYRSGALTPRFFVFQVPIAGLALAVAVGRLRVLAVVVGIAATLALVSMLDGYTSEPSSYRQAAALIRSTNAAGDRSCVVDIGVSPMEAYVDAPRDFTIVTKPEQLHGCDVVVVASWWPSTTAGWYANDLRVMAAADTEFGYKKVLASEDPALVYSRRPLDDTVPT